MTFWEVTLNGVRCDTQTWDNFLQGGGWGDEIFFHIPTQITDPGGKVLTWPDVSRSLVHGQTAGWINRIKAGSCTDTGGFQTGDEFPTPNPWSRKGRNLRPDSLPMRIWSGPLDANTVAAFTPTIWEWDGGQDVLTTLFDQLKTNGVEIAKAIAEAYGTLTSDPNVKPVVEILSGAVPAVTAFLGSLIGQQGDRPIGTQQDAKGVRTFKPLTFILSETIGDRVIANNYGEGPGIVELEYADSDNIGRGSYRVWLQVSKISDPPDGTIAQGLSSPEVYVFFGGARFRLPHAEWGLARYGGRVQHYPDAAMRALRVLPRDRTLLKEEGAPEVWLIEKGRKRWVKSAEVLGRLGGWSKVRWVPDGALAKLKKGPDLAK